MQCPKGARVSKLESELADPFKRAGADRLVVYTPEVLRSALLNAVSEGSLENVKLCVQRGASPLWRDEEGASCGLTPLQVAVCSTAPPADRIAILKYLLEESGPAALGDGEAAREASTKSLNDIDYLESTALHHAAALGEPAVIEFLIKAGANPKVYDAEGLTPLHLAANNGHVSAATALLQNWAPVDAADDTDEPEDTTDTSKTPLERMRLRKDRAQRRMAHTGAGLYIAARGTALHVCAAADRPAVAQVLLGLGGADSSSPTGPQGSTPLHIAARCGHEAMVALLLEGGADVDARDDAGETALFRAVEGEHAPLHVAAACGLRACFGPLVERGADPNASCRKTYKDWDGGRTPMHYAAHHGDLEAFKELIALGGDPRAFSKMTCAWGEPQPGWPPLFYAVESKNLELSEWIMSEDLRQGVHCVVSARRTPLMVAAMQGWKEGIAAILSKYPFYLDWKDDLGRTALHWAAHRSEGEVINDLMGKHGADPHTKDNDGKAPGDLYTGVTRPPPARMWEEERVGAMGERSWDYQHIMESTAFRYLRRATSARRAREIAKERQCSHCGRYTFDALRCSACKAAYYCSGTCQEAHWKKGGHRLYCLTKFVPSGFPLKL